MYEKIRVANECEYCGRNLLLEEHRHCERCDEALVIYELGEHVMCLECGRLFGEIQTNHLRCCSNLTILEYRRKYPRASTRSIRYTFRYSNSRKGYYDRIPKNVYQEYCKIMKKTHSTQQARENNSRGRIEYWKTISSEERSRFMKELDGKTVEKRSRGLSRYFSDKKNCEKKSFEQKLLIESGHHNWNNVSPFGLEDEPLERILDLSILYIFVADVLHIFRTLKPWDSHSKMHQLDFVCWPLKFNLEADELAHEDFDHKIWDDKRNVAFVETREIETIHRYKQLRAEEDLVNVVKEIYELCNHLRERYQLFYLPVLQYDERWSSYFEKMQALLKKFREIRDYKNFVEAKREIDRQYLNLLEETTKDYSVNFSHLVRESFDTNKNIDQSRIISPWRTNV